MNTPLRLKEWKTTPNRTQLFAFSAITWNRHRIHFDRTQAEAEGFPDVVVQRGLIGNFFARFALQSGGPESRLERLQWKVLRSAFPDQELRVQGDAIIEGSEEDAATYALRILNPADELIAEGQAKVRIRK